MRKSVIGIGILAFVIGLMMIIAPQEVIKVAVIVIGVTAIANGVYNLIKVRKLVADEDFERLTTIRGIMSILVGAIAIIFPIIFAETIWVAMSYMLAVYLIISAALALYGATKMKAAGISTKMFSTEIVVSFIVAIVLFLIPAAIGRVIIRILGIAVIVGAAGFLYWEWKNKPDYVYAEDVTDETTDNQEK
jgi:uncharacterized membrane protein HdeD (DUF308 family)